MVPRLVRRQASVVSVPAEELLQEARVSSRRLYAALTVVLSVDFAVLSGALTFWALALR